MRYILSFILIQLLLSFPCFGKVYMAAYRIFEGGTPGFADRNNYAFTTGTSFPLGEPGNVHQGIYTFGYWCENTSGSCAEDLTRARGECTFNGKIIQDGDEFFNGYIMRVTNTNGTHLDSAQFDTSSFTTRSDSLLGIHFEYNGGSVYPYGVAFSPYQFIICQGHADVINESDRDYSNIHLSMRLDVGLSVPISLSGGGVIKKGTLGQSFDFPFYLTIGNKSVLNRTLLISYRLETDAGCTELNPVFKKGDDIVQTGVTYTMNTPFSTNHLFNAILTPTTLGDFSCTATMYFSPP